MSFCGGPTSGCRIEVKSLASDKTIKVLRKRISCGLTCATAQISPGQIDSPLDLKSFSSYSYPTFWCSPWTWSPTNYQLELILSFRNITLFVKSMLRAIRSLNGQLREDFPSCRIG